ncbi:hypothetical protein PUN28_013389 [Cardiocondyla obscurior]|uniref:Uncharacterized protein n=1 Tax=Cardiocondyla obscurior TaxID=286306 RepID=A0AAW2FD21_9HYME
MTTPSDRVPQRSAESHGTVTAREERRPWHSMYSYRRDTIVNFLLVVTMPRFRKKCTLSFTKGRKIFHVYPFLRIDVKPDPRFALRPYSYLSFYIRFDPSSLSDGWLAPVEFASSKHVTPREEGNNSSHNATRAFQGPSRVSARRDKILPTFVFVNRAFNKRFNLPPLILISAPRIIHRRESSHGVSCLLVCASGREGVGKGASARTNICPVVFRPGVSDVANPFVNFKRTIAGLGPWSF